MSEVVLSRVKQTAENARLAQDFQLFYFQCTAAFIYAVTVKFLVQTTDWFNGPSTLWPTPMMLAMSATSKTKKNSWANAAGLVKTPPSHCALSLCKIGPH